MGMGMRTGGGIEGGGEGTLYIWFLRHEVKILQWLQVSYLMRKYCH